MKTYQKSMILVAGISLYVATATVQAGNVGFSISYSDHDYKRHAYSQSYHRSYYTGHIIQYNYHPYYGVKQYKKHHVHTAHCNHGYSGNYSPSYKYQTHYYKHQQYPDKYNKHQRRAGLYHDSYGWNKHRSHDQRW